MQQTIREIEQSYRKQALPQVQSGDTVRVHQQIREGGKSRVQVFEGVIVRTHRLGELSAVITVRRIASGVGVEKTFLLHSPNVVKVQVVRRSKVRRNFLSYLRERRGKSARLTEVAFDRQAANVAEPVATTDDAKDAEVTEIEVAEAESIKPAENLDAETKEENQAAAAEDVAGDPDAQDDEQALPAQEVEAGEARAEDEDSRAQRPVE